MLDELRVVHGRLDEPVPISDSGGTVRVELNHTDPASLPWALVASLAVVVGSVWFTGDRLRSFTLRGEE